MSEKEICKMYSEFYGEEIDKLEQIAHVVFNGKELKEFIEHCIEFNNVALGSVRRSALEWWNNLTLNQQRDYEYRTFGDGEPWEDNRLTDADIETIYMSRN